MKANEEKWIRDLQGRMDGFEKTAPVISWDAVMKEASRRKRRVVFWPVAAAVSAVAAAVALFVFPSGEDEIIRVVEQPAQSFVADIPSSDGQTLSGGQVPESQARPESPGGPASKAERVPTAVPSPSEAAMGFERAEASQQQAEAVRTTDDKSVAETDAVPENKASGGKEVDRNEPEINEPTIHDDWTYFPETKKAGHSRKLTTKMMVGAGNISTDLKLYDDPIKDFTNAERPNQSNIGVLGEPVPEENSPETKGPSNGIVTDNRKASGTSDHHQPIRLGAMLRYELTPRWSVESGLVWSILKSDITHKEQNVSLEGSRTLNYLGIPLNLSYKVIGKNGFNVYANAGGMVEKMVRGYSDSRALLADSKYSLQRQDVQIKELQTSANFGISLEYKLFNKVGLYCEPGVAWYFKGQNKIRTFYNESPLAFSLDVGLKIDI